MNVLSHRGFWIEAAERNSAAAFARTKREGFGTETDVRDAGGRLVVSHDPSVGPSAGPCAGPSAGTALPWDHLISTFSGSGLPLAVNVKADGLAPQLAAAFAFADIDWFAFDMSAPEMLRYARLGLPYYSRQSDIEPEPILYERARGVWLDAFEDTWFDGALIERHLGAGKAVCVVSPELHGREPQPLWDMLRRLARRPGLSLCTDYPTQAREFFRS